MLEHMVSIMNDPDDHLMEQMQIYIEVTMTMTFQGGATLLARVMTTIGFASGGDYYGKKIKTVSSVLLCLKV